MHQLSYYLCAKTIAKTFSETQGFIKFFPDLRNNDLKIYFNQLKENQPK